MWILAFLDRCHSRDSTLSFEYQTTASRKELQGKNVLITERIAGEKRPSPGGGPSARRSWDLAPGRRASAMPTRPRIEIRPTSQKLEHIAAPGPTARNSNARGNLSAVGRGSKAERPWSHRPSKRTWAEGPLPRSTAPHRHGARCSDDTPYPGHSTLPYTLRFTAGHGTRHLTRHTGLPLSFHYEFRNPIRPSADCRDRLRHGCRIRPCAGDRGID